MLDRGYKRRLHTNGHDHFRLNPTPDSKGVQPPFKQGTHPFSGNPQMCSLFLDSSEASKSYSKGERRFSENWGPSDQSLRVNDLICPPIPDGCHLPLFFASPKEGSTMFICGADGSELDNGQKLPVEFRSSVFGPWGRRRLFGPLQSANKYLYVRW